MEQDNSCYPRPTLLRDEQSGASGGAPSSPAGLCCTADTKTAGRSAISDLDRRLQERLGDTGLSCALEDGGRLSLSAHVAARKDLRVYADSRRLRVPRI